MLELVALAFVEPPAPPSEAEVAKLILEALTVVGGALAGLGALVGYFLTRYWYNKDRSADQRERAQAAIAAEQSKLRDILYESLKWFEGGTQNRSIGIAVVKTSWKTFEDFQPLWLEVLANQAIYLLAASDQGTKAHEHENLRRIMNLAVSNKDRLGRENLDLLCSALKEKHAGVTPGGLSLTPVLKGRITDWLSDLGVPMNLSAGQVCCE
jgi:hypothetical protein